MMDIVIQLVMMVNVHRVQIALHINTAIWASAQTSRNWENHVSIEMNAVDHLHVSI